MLNSSTHIKDIKNHNVLQRSGRAHNIEMSSVQSGRAQRTHAFLGVIIRPLPIHWQIPGRVLQLLNWFQLMGVLDPVFWPTTKVLLWTFYLSKSCCTTLFRQHTTLNCYFLDFIAAKTLEDAKFWSSKVW